jgi:hypothetical protein
MLFSPVLEGIKYINIYLIKNIGMNLLFTFFGQIIVKIFFEPIGLIVFIIQIIGIILPTLLIFKKKRLLPYIIISSIFFAIYLFIGQHLFNDYLFQNRLAPESHYGNL